MSLGRPSWVALQRVGLLLSVALAAATFLLTSTPLTSISPGAAPPSPPEGVAPGPSVPVATVTRHLTRDGEAGRINSLAPDFEWADPDGSSQQLSLLAGGPLVVNFWATWCVPCRTEMPAFQRIASDTRGVHFLMIDMQEEPGAVIEFAQELGLRDLRLIIDTDGRLARRYGVFSLPMTYYVGSDGLIRHIDVGGPLEGARIRRGIDKAREPR